MESETAKKSLAKLQGFFGKNLTTEAVAFYVSDFRSVDDEIFVSAVPNGRNRPDKSKRPT